MDILLEGVGKRYQNQVIFAGIDLDLKAGDRLVVLGGNGSGKSTFLRILAGSLALSGGRIQYQGFPDPKNDFSFARSISFAGPYQELPEEFSLMELLDFSLKFKNLLPEIHRSDFLELAGLSHAGSKQIRHYSSGMKQRARIALAVLMDAEVVILDEPTSNLDPDGKRWYADLMDRWMGNRTVVVGSNFLDEEFPFPHHTLELKDHKPQRTKD
ncbi:MAG: ABC transporter ATP-binding protein [Bacteroidota bacterium]|nr:ABC transporter ATP-binding protein [Bacteroidota bacterium]